MERFRPRAALEPEVRFRFPALIVQLCIGGVLGAPLFAFGHGAQFVLGKVTPLEGGRVRLELTADYGQNPMIESLEHARESLCDLMRWRGAGKDELPFQVLPEPVFEERAKLDPTIPLPTDEEQLAADHQLLTGIWEWGTGTEGVQFQVREKTPLDVLLWTERPEASSSENEGTRWAVLIAGDVSPVVELPEMQDPVKKASLAAAAVGLMLLGWIARCALNRRIQPGSTARTNLSRVL